MKYSQMYDALIMTEQEYLALVAFFNVGNYKITKVELNGLKKVIIQRP
jgi:hypothetical protein